MATDTKKEKERRKDMALQFFQGAWVEKNYEILEEVLAPDYVDHNVANPDAPVEGRAEMREYMEKIGDAIPDKEKHIQNLVVGDGEVGDDCVVIHYLTTGTHSKELKGYEPTGEQIEVPGVYILRFEDGLIAEGWDTSDTLSYWKQIGATIE